MTEAQLIELSAEENSQLYNKTVHSWTAEVYSIGKHLRKYGFYPRSLPLYVHTDHGGPIQSDEIFTNDINAKSPVVLFHSPRYAEHYNKISRRGCHVMYAPFVFYRRSNNIQKASDAKGTLAFAAHSTPLIDDVSDVNKYIDDLLGLPEKFHPISAIIHPVDVHKGLHKPFIARGIPVYTAGHSMDHRFAERLYDIMRNFEFTTANVAMSCLFYSVEMGIPHFLFGNPPLYINKADKNLAIGEQYNPKEDYPQGMKIAMLFEGLHSEISPQQREIVEFELGLHNGVGRLHCAYLLYSAYIRYHAKAKAVKTIQFFGRLFRIKKFL